MRSPASDCGRNPHARTRVVKDAHQSSLHGSSCLTEQQELTPKDRAPQDVLSDTQRPRLPNIVVLHVTASQAFVSSPGSVLAPSLVVLVSNQHVIRPNPASSSIPNFKHAALNHHRPRLMHRPPIACRRAVQSLQNPTPHHVWVTDDLLSVAVNRFFRIPCPHQKRQGSHVPGPLEARRRAAKRRMTASANFHPQDNLPPLFSLGALFGLSKQPQPSWKYEPPWSPRDLESLAAGRFTQALGIV